MTRIPFRLSAAVALSAATTLTFGACETASYKTEAASALGTDAAGVDVDATSGVEDAGSSPAAFTIFLNFDGAAVTTGPDDSSINRASVVSEDSTTDPFNHALYATTASREEVITDITDGVAALFEPFDVAVVNERPASGDYVMALVGGKPGSIGMPQQVAAAAPATCDFIDRAVVFVFTDLVLPGDYASQLQWTSSTIAKEVGLAYGLEHVTYCRDVMYNLGHCGPSTFMDFDADCQGGSCRCRDSATQSSFALLGALLGLD